MLFECTEKEHPNLYGALLEITVDANMNYFANSILLRFC